MFASNVNHIAMKKIYIKLVLLVSLCLPLLANAQSNYKPGYVVNFKNDTLKGYIDYREWRNNPVSFNFKTSLTAKGPEKFSVQNAKAVGITNLEYYQRAIIKISTGSIDVGNLKTAVDTGYYIDTVFLKEVTTGKNVSLFELTEPVKIHFYIKENSQGQLNELNYYMFSNNSDLQTVYAFRKQLIALILTYKPGDDKLVAAAQNTGYTEADLKGVAEQINGGETGQYVHEKLSRMRFLAGAGVKSNKLTFNGENGPFPAGASSSNTFPFLSGGVDFITNKNTNKIILRLEASFTNNQYSFNNPTPTSLIVNSTLSLKQFNVTLVPQVIYNFYSGDNFKAFLGAGIAFNFSFYNNYNYINYYFDQNNIIQNKYPPFDKAWPSFPLKAGVQINNKLEIYGCYFPSSAIISNILYTADISSFQFGINYLF